MAAVTFTDQDTPDINSFTDATSYLTASWTPPTTGIIYVWVWSREAGGNTAVSSVTGNSLTWVSIASFGYSSNTRRITLFAALASGATTGQTTIDYGANTQLGCSAHFMQAENVDTSGGIAAAFVQTPTNSGTTDTSGSVTLATAGHADNRPACFFEHSTNEAVTGDAAYSTDSAFNGTGPARGMISQYDTDGFASPTVTWTTASIWGGMATEIKASSPDRTVVSPVGAATVSAPTPVVGVGVVSPVGAATVSAPTPVVSVSGGGQTPPFANIVVR